MIPPELARIFRDRTVHTPSGEPRTLGSSIPMPYAIALHETVLARSPTSVLEIGMAHAISTVAIASALDANGDGSLVSIDPHQSTYWEGIGLETIRRAGVSGRHTLIEATDYVALPKLIAQGCRFDFVYIDGWHTF